MHSRAAAVLQYWLGVDPATLAADKAAWKPDQPKMWFQGGEAVDKEVVEQFSADLAAVRAGEYDAWLTGGNAREAVAGIIIMDQFTRNAYRNTAEMYSLDDKAMAWCKQLMGASADTSLALAERIWLYMPFMHSEELEDQEACVRYFEQLAADAEAAGAPGLAGFASYAGSYAGQHRDVVAAWGRFPHRNAILGRASTPEEVKGLEEGSIKSF